MSFVEPQALRLLPVAEGLCVQCATDHGKHDPHNFWSVFYGMRFKMQHGRHHTHADCIAHLPYDHLGLYRRALSEFGREWSEPPEGVPPIPEVYERR